MDRITDVHLFYFYFVDIHTYIHSLNMEIILCVEGSERIWL
jgi:hypothetical protein